MCSEETPIADRMTASSSLPFHLLASCYFFFSRGSGPSLPSGSAIAPPPQAPNPGCHSFFSPLLGALPAPSQRIFAQVPAPAFAAPPSAIGGSAKQSAKHLPSEVATPPPLCSQLPPPFPSLRPDERALSFAPRSTSPSSRYAWCFGMP